MSSTTPSQLQPLGFQGTRVVTCFRDRYGPQQMGGLWRTIHTFLRDPEPTGRLEEVASGLNLVDGIVHVSEPLRSPVRGQNCAAYFYRSFLVITESRAPAYHKLKQAEVYTSFRLEMEGGFLDVVPARPPRFEREEHQQLSRQYGKGFQGIEEVILPGARVRVRGRARREEGKLVLRLTGISVLEKQAIASGVVGDRKKRRRKKN